LKRVDTLDLGNDNKFLVISLDPADEYDEDKDEADDVDEGKEEVALDRDNKEGALDRDNEDDKADNKKPPSYPKRRDGEDDEEPYPPTTATAEVAGLANKYNFGKKTAGVMWHLYDKNHGRDGSDGSFHPTFPHQKVARDEGHR
jgi:hypothetical protein